jgi:hypothetical protein
MQPGIDIPFKVPAHPIKEMLHSYERSRKNLWNSCGHLCKRRQFHKTYMEFRNFGGFACGGMTESGGSKSRLSSDGVYEQNSVLNCGVCLLAFCRKI